jgi:hypothetical protein
MRLPRWRKRPEDPPRQYITLKLPSFSWRYRCALPALRNRFSEAVALFKTGNCEVASLDLHSD